MRSGWDTYEQGVVEQEEKWLAVLFDLRWKMDGVVGVWWAHWEVPGWA